VVFVVACLTQDCQIPGLVAATVCTGLDVVNFQSRLERAAADFTGTPADIRIPAACGGVLECRLASEPAAQRGSSIHERSGETHSTGNFETIEGCACTRLESAVVDKFISAVSCGFTAYT
jgi:hypothetical protein